MNRKMALNFTGSMAVWLCYCLLSAACEDNVSTPSDRGQEVSLSFNVAVDGVKDTQDVPATRGVSIHDTDKFPDTGNLVNPLPKAGMFITTLTGGEVFPKSARMKVTSQLNGTALSFYAFNETNTSNMLQPKGFTGSTIRVAAYWPWNDEATDINSGVPFDFTTINSTNKKQQDLLYYGEDVAMPDDGRLSLTFKHAYCRVKIKVKKYEDKDEVRLTSVGIGNLSGEWIKNKGNIDLMTGYPKAGAQAGALVELADVTLSHSAFETYEFLVPAFMSPDIGNEEVMLQMMIDGRLKVFPLDRKYLNTVTGDGGRVSYGFAQGHVNTYEVVYNNSAMDMRLLGWYTQSSDGAFGEQMGDGPGILMTEMRNPPSALIWGSYPTKGLAAKGTYQNYLSTVALGNNGSYVSGDRAFESDYDGWGNSEFPFEGDKNVYSEEKPVRGYMSARDVITVPIAWEGEDGELIAQEICRKYRGGGFDTWRLPRASELRMVAAAYSYNADNYNRFDFKTVDNAAGPYWTATEVDARQAWAVTIKYSNRVTPLRRVVLERYNKKSGFALVRCVRDY